MKTGLTRKQTVTEFYFNEHDDLAELSYPLAFYQLAP